MSTDHVQAFSSVIHLIPIVACEHSQTRSCRVLRRVMNSHGDVRHYIRVVPSDKHLQFHGCACLLRKKYLGSQLGFKPKAF